MARKHGLLDNPLGLVTKRYPACRVKGGERTHIFMGAAALCGAGRSRNGRTIPGAVIRSGKKVSRGEIDCLRCIKILKLDPELTGSPTTVEYAGGKPKRSKTGAVVLRKIKPSSPQKRAEHVMVAGGRAGAYIGKSRPKGAKAYRRKPDEMSKWQDKRGYVAAEVSGFGPAYITAYEPDGTPARHKFRRGSDKHPTQTRMAKKKWLTRSPGSAAPRPVVRRPAREEIALVANPKRRNSAEFKPKKGLKYYDNGTLAEVDKVAAGYVYYHFLIGPYVGEQFRISRKMWDHYSRPIPSHFAKKNPSVSFRTADGRSVSFKTKAKKR